MTTQEGQAITEDIFDFEFMDNSQTPMTRNRNQYRNKVKRSGDKKKFSLTTEKLIEEIELEHGSIKLTPG